MRAVLFQTSFFESAEVVFCPSRAVLGKVFFPAQDTVPAPEGLHLWWQVGCSLFVQGQLQLTPDAICQGAAILAPILPSQAKLLPPHKKLEFPVVEPQAQEVVHDVPALLNFLSM